MDNQEKDKNVVAKILGGDISSFNHDEGNAWVACGITSQRLRELWEIIAQISKKTTKISEIIEAIEKSPQLTFREKLLVAYNFDQILTRQRLEPFMKKIMEDFFGDKENRND